MHRLAGIGPYVTSYIFWGDQGNKGWRGPTASQLIRGITDIIILNFVFVLSMTIRYFYAVSYQAMEISAEDLFGILSMQYLRFAPVASALAVAIFYACGFYTYGRAYQTRYKAIVVSQAVTILFMVLGLLAFLAPSAIDMPRSVLLMTWAMSVVLFVLSRAWSAAFRYAVRTEASGGGAGPERAPGDGDGSKTVLVIGGAGYIGSALLPKLLANGYRVRILDLFLYGTEPIADYLEHPRVELIRSDFRHIDALVRAMRGVDQVVHLGGIVGDPACAIDEELTIDVNLTATRLIAEVAKGHGIKRFIFASTCSVYGASSELLDEHSKVYPLSLYARSKVASEKVLLEMADSSFTPIIVRFATIFGLSGRTRFDLVVNLLAAKAVFDRKITIFGGGQWRPFLHVDDAALALSQLLRMPVGRGAEVFNVGSNTENYTIKQIGTLVKKYVPEAEVVLHDKDHDQRDYRVNFSKIAMLTGFKPRWTVEQGVQQVIDAIRAGSVANYTEMMYSNEKFLHATKGTGFAAPTTKWAHELIHSAMETSGPASIPAGSPGWSAPPVLVLGRQAGHVNNLKSA